MKYKLNYDYLLNLKPKIFYAIMIIILLIINIFIILFY